MDKGTLDDVPLVLTFYNNHFTISIRRIWISQLLELDLLTTEPAEKELMTSHYMGWYDLCLNRTMHTQMSPSHWEQL